MSEILPRRHLPRRISGRLSDGTPRRELLNSMASRHLPMYCDASHLRLKDTDFAETILKTLRMMCRPSARAARNVHVLCLTLLPAFDDACMEALIDLLKSSNGRNIFSINLGEKGNISFRMWQEFCECLPKTGIRYLFVDTKDLLLACEKQVTSNCGKHASELLRKMKENIRESRHHDDAKMSSTPPAWKCPVVAGKLEHCFHPPATRVQALAHPMNI